jgi:hypothetical protein
VQVHPQLVQVANLLHQRVVEVLHATPPAIKDAGVEACVGESSNVVPADR